MKYIKIYVRKAVIAAGRDGMGFKSAIRTCLSKYVTFSGRASRSEYWWFLLFAVLGVFVLGILDMILFGVDTDSRDSRGYLTSVWQLAMFLPLLAAGWRRLQDAGRPGWYILLPMIVTLVSVVGLFFGVVSFGVVEQNVADPDSLRGPAAVLGVTGLFVVGVVQLVLTILMLWWLTRPSDTSANAYGPPPAG